MRAARALGAGHALRGPESHRPGRLRRRLVRWITLAARQFAFDAFAARQFTLDAPFEHAFTGAFAARRLAFDAPFEHAFTGAFAARRLTFDATLEHAFTGALAARQLTFDAPLEHAFTGAFASRQLALAARRLALNTSFKLPVDTFAFVAHRQPQRRRARAHGASHE